MGRSHPSQSAAVFELRFDPEIRVCDGPTFLYVDIRLNGSRRHLDSWHCVVVEDGIDPRYEAPPWTLARTLYEACRDDEHGTRILAAVAHGLLPQGGHRWDRRVPDGLFLPGLRFGGCVTYRATIRGDVRAELRELPELTWGHLVEQPGTDERAAFTRCLDQAALDAPAWLAEALERVRAGAGTRFDRLVAQCVTPAAVRRVARVVSAIPIEHRTADRPRHG